MDEASAITERSEAELLAAVRAGEDEAFGLLWSRHEMAARRLAAQIAPASNVEDLVSESFYRVLRTIKAGGGPQDAFRPYLFSTMRRFNIDTGRSYQQRVTLTGEAADLDVEHAESAADVAAMSTEQRTAWLAWASLPEASRALLWHLVIEEETPAQIAPLLGTTANGVASRAVRAKERLRQAFLQQHLAAAGNERCREVRNQLGAYVRDALSARDRAAVDAHLTDCERCRAALAEISDVNRSLRGLIAPIILGGSLIAGRYLTASAAAHGTAAVTAGAAHAGGAAGAGQAGAAAGAGQVGTAAGAGQAGVAAGGGQAGAAAGAAQAGAAAGTAPVAAGAGAASAVGAAAGHVGGAAAQRALRASAHAKPASSFPSTAVAVVAGVVIAGVLAGWAALSGSHSHHQVAAPSVAAGPPITSSASATATTPSITSSARPSTRPTAPAVVAPTASTVPPGATTPPAGATSLASPPPAATTPTVGSSSGAQLASPAAAPVAIATASAANPPPPAPVVSASPPPPSPRSSPPTPLRTVRVRVMVRGPIEQINFSVSAGWTIDFARIPGVGVCSGGGQALTCAVVRQPRTYPITVQVSGRGTGGTLHVVSIGLNGQTSDYPF